MNQLTTQRQRIFSIDILRGIVMVIMALDHVRDFFYKVPVTDGGSVATGPTDLATTTPALFFTRWITHFCAPIFLFLAGVSIFLMSRRKSKSQLSGFLLTRGIWLILIEVIIITFAWTFNPFFNLIILQVIWAIGISMVVFALFIFLPDRWILFLGLLIVFGHNLLNYPSIASHLKGGAVPDLVYFASFSQYGLTTDHSAMIVYSFLPWTGIMLTGYGFGRLFTDQVSPTERRRFLLLSGSALIALFCVLRLINGYGDPVPWSTQARGPVFTFLSFLNVNKYPPSLDFFSITIGSGLIMLAVLERAQSSIAGFFRVFGRVPMLYYVLHLYLIHVIGVIVFFAQGFSKADIVTPKNPFFFRPSGIGFGLPGVYLVWLTVILLLYPVCRAYNRYKSVNGQWWLSYV
ncbi:MAG TPA: heparan-alpha-glucosaminide N-acetyltransferase domain-containing protein [Chitinophagaceae bacterium]